MDVLELVAQDLTNKMIGKALYLSEDTIKTHLKRLYDKLGVSTRLGAVVAATGRGLIPCHCRLSREARGGEGIRPTELEIDGIRYIRSPTDEA